MNKKLVLALAGFALCGAALAGPQHIDPGTLDRHHHGHRRHWCPPPPPPPPPMHRCRW